MLRDDGRAVCVDSDAAGRWSSSERVVVLRDDGRAVSGSCAAGRWSGSERVDVDVEVGIEATSQGER